MAVQPAKPGLMSCMGGVAIALAVALTTPVPAFADWRSEIGTFRIGIAAPSGEPDAPSTLETFRQHVSAVLSVPVEIVITRDLPALIDLQANKRVDYSVMTAIGFRVTDRLCRCVTPIAAPTAADGTTGVVSVLLGDGQQVRSLEDLATARLGEGPNGSLTAHLVPAIQFRWNGQSPFKAEIDRVAVSSADDAMAKLAADEIDAWFGWASAGDGDATDGFAARMKSVHDMELVPLWTSSPVPFGPHAVRSDLAPEAIDLLTAMLETLDEKAPLAFDAVSPRLGGGFRTVEAIEYGGLDAYIREWVGSATGPAAPQLPVSE